MGQKKHPFTLILSKKADAGTNDLAMPQIEDGRIYCIQRVAAENETSAFTELRILKDGVGGEFFYAEQDSPSAATLYWMKDPIYLGEGQYLVARFTGCTAGDVLKCYITGYWMQAREIDE